jgi:endonuclease-8
MPEGHTIFRAAAEIERWVGGRVVTAASTTVDRLPADRLVGQTVDRVEPRGKHLLIRFSGGQVLHTHLKMTGAWHVYRAGERWRRPAWQARFVLEAGDRVAVCFGAPVVELLAPRGEHLHPALAGLGPDVLAAPVDLDEIRRRARLAPDDLAVGELLLDQRVVSGIGNIWRCEALFVRRVHPAAAIGSLSDDELDGIVTAASQLMRHNVEGRDRGDRWVYGRARRPCRRCSTPIRASRVQASERTAYWCPRCQPAPGDA